MAASSIFNNVTELRSLNEGGFYLRVASIFKSLLYIVTRWYLNVIFLSVDTIGHFESANLAGLALNETTIMPFDRRVCVIG